MSAVSTAEARIPRRRLVAFGRYAVALAILAWLLDRISPASVLEVASSAAPSVLLAAVLLALLTHVAVADRLRRLVQALGMRLSTLSLLQINLATVFYALILPAGNVTGIIARFYRMSRREPNYAATAVALWLEGLLATLTLCLIGIVLWVVDWPAAWPAFVPMLGALAALLALGAVLFAETSSLVRLRGSVGHWWPERLASLRRRCATRATCPAVSWPRCSRSAS